MAKADFTTPLSSGQTCDALVVGAGVVGCAVTRKLALEGARVILVDKEADILGGASKANSAILHTGFDAPSGSIELSCIAAGYREFREIHKRFKLPLVQSGAMVLAWDDTQASQIESIVSKAHANGVDDVIAIDAQAARARVPALAPNIKAAVLIPGESLVDPWSTPLAYLHHALVHEAQFVNQCEVTMGHFEGEYWRVSTNQGDLRARWLVNCAGLYGDVLHDRLNEGPQFSIRPRKGQFLVYDKPAARLTNTILLPVPTETSKGIVVCPTVFGNLLVGPSAEDQDSRDDTSVDAKILSRLKSVGAKCVAATWSTQRYSGLCGHPSRDTDQGLSDSLRQETTIPVYRWHSFNRAQCSTGNCPTGSGQNFFLPVRISSCRIDSMAHCTENQ